MSRALDGLAFTHVARGILLQETGAREAARAELEAALEITRASVESSLDEQGVEVLALWRLEKRREALSLAAPLAVASYYTLEPAIRHALEDAGLVRLPDRTESAE